MLEEAGITVAQEFHLASHSPPFPIIPVKSLGRQGFNVQIGPPCATASTFPCRPNHCTMRRRYSLYTLSVETNSTNIHALQYLGSWLFLFWRHSPNVHRHAGRIFYQDTELSGEASTRLSQGCSVIPASCCCSFSRLFCAFCLRARGSRLAKSCH